MGRESAGSEVGAGDGGWSFVLMPLSVLCSPDLTDGAVRLYGVLLRYADRVSGEAWPSQETLAAALGWERCTIYRHLRTLRRAGFVRVQTRRTPSGKQNLYTLTVLVSNIAERDSVAELQPPPKGNDARLQPPNDARLQPPNDAELQQELDPSLSEPCLTDPSLDSSSCPDSPQSSSRTKRPGKSYPVDSQPYRLAAILRSLILEADPNAKVPGLTTAGFEKWCDEVRLLIERDDRDPETVERLIRFARADSFWSTVIFSPANLRKQQNKLFARMNANTSRPPQGQATAAKGVANPWRH